MQEFIDGHTLTKELTINEHTFRKLPEEQTIEILQEILIGVVEVHSKNKIHRDLKPDNIMRRVEDGKLVLIDFGTVKEVCKSTNPNGQKTIAIGTHGYMSYEQSIGQPHFASDVYAVGWIGIQCLIGRGLDQNTSILPWQQMCQISPGLMQVLEKMVAYYPHNRYQDATEALGAIDRLIAQRSQRPIASTPYSPPQSSNQPKVSNPAPLPTIKSPLPPLVKRRPVLKYLGLGGSSVMGAWLIAQLFNRPSSTLEDAKAGLRKISFTSVRLNSSGQIVARPKGSALSFQEDLGDGVSMTMVKIPAGKFMMGSPENEKYRDSDESPQHSVTVPEFYLGQTLVTQAQWQALMGNNPSSFKGNSKLPVDSVNWLDAMDFCQKLSQKTGHTYRLPSEAEWEYACRAGTTTPFAFGETITPEIVNYNGNYPYGNAAKGEYRQKTTIVGSFPANAFGLYDMHGNLYEWCLDEWNNNYNNAPADGSARGDINSRDSDKHRLLRGGSWDNNARNCRSANRINITASGRNYNIGLRVVAGSARTS